MRRIFLLPFLSAQALILVHFLYLALPTAGVVLVPGSSDISIPTNHGGVESSDVTRVQARSWASFLNPSHIIESIKNMTGAIQTSVEPKLSQPDFWRMVKEYEESFQEHVSSLLQDAAKQLEPIGATFTDVSSAMNNIVNATATFRNDIAGVLEVHQITHDAFSEEIQAVFMVVANDMEKIPFPDQAPGHAERQKMVDKIFNDTASALADLAVGYGIDVDTVETYLHVLKPPIYTIVIAIGDVNEQYPLLLPSLLFCIVAPLIGELWVLRPVLRLFGFGPAGPIRGSFATWLQRQFWGGAVKSGSWFSILQSAAMTAAAK